MLRQEDTIIPAEKIKSEPIDFVDNDLNYDAEADEVRGNGDVNEHEDVNEEEEDDDEDKGDFLKITLMQKDANSEKFAVLEIDDRVDVDDSEEVKSPKKLERTKTAQDEGKSSGKMGLKGKKIQAEEEEEKGEVENEKKVEEKDLPMPVLSPIHAIEEAAEEKGDETLKRVSETENLSENDCKNEENK